MTHKSQRTRITAQEALQFHSQGKPGKLEITPTKPLLTQRDLALAYSPGVAVPVEAIADNPSLAYDYTNKGNLVAVVSNGTAILGLGNLGALASKPVMEGKGALFKRFADIDAMDLLVDTEDVDQFINCVRYLGPTFGGINLEDIKAPDCFIIEERLKELLDIPVFHDDQHGTAIIAAAGLINALELTGRDVENFSLVVNGAGAAGIACIELMCALGMPRKNVVLCDTKGVIYEGRKAGMNQWKSAFASKTKARTLAEALAGADAFFGLSAKGAVTAEMVASMAPKPIIFAMANPDPEITPEEVQAVRDDAIVATGRSDYPNQVNNVLGFPFIFRGALDVQARTINDAMKIAAAQALAALAREDVPDAVTTAFLGRRLTFGPEYIIPAPFDPRLISRIPPAVARAAMDSGVARRPIVDMDGYVSRLKGRLDPVSDWLQSIFEAVRAAPKRVVFADGEELAVIRAANAYISQGFGVPILIGSEDAIRRGFHEAGIKFRPEFEIVDATRSPLTEEFAEHLYTRLQRRGYLRRDCLRMVRNERNVFASLMVAHGLAQGMVAGVTRNWTSAFEDVRRVIDAKPGRHVIGVSLALNRGRGVLVADTNVHDMPTAEELANIATEAANAARKFGIEPRVALLAYSTFGQPPSERTAQVLEAVRLLSERDVDFEFDGDMAADVALSPDLLKLYPFCRLSGPANVLVMPAFHAASISTKMLGVLGGATIIGPLLVGLEKSVQISALGAKDEDLVNLAALAAYDLGG
ncbi:MAG: NADP-dependent malic enzyme [Hyphomicrobium sp.]|jgi:malate dehydrogenase (oxaloacetate-decarboxylating)(NADP+)|uniref:NADP-dependent malic enzyme n=1 Tax=Hyphomicrobium sp. TaxID=82 RepID=UPI0025C5ACB5|nr:NADP-dependent malic enzyme [Hyphomicrobium sp.]MBX9861648.1 NADP-dependent malic enzyme [Hyphomicrobium sp.]